VTTYSHPRDKCGRAKRAVKATMLSGTLAAATAPARAENPQV
jgi:hypothetical protein